MLRAIEVCANTNRWHRHTGPVAVFCAGLMACVLLAPPLAAGPLVGAAAVGTTAGIDGGAAGQQSHRLRRPTVIAQRGQ